MNAQNKTKTYSSVLHSHTVVQNNALGNIKTTELDCKACNHIPKSPKIIFNVSVMKDF